MISRAKLYFKINTKWFKDWDEILYNPLAQKPLEIQQKLDLSILPLSVIILRFLTKTQKYGIENCYNFGHISKIILGKKVYNIPF